MLAAALLLAGWFDFTALELEVAGGAAHSLEPNSPTYDYPVATPTLQGRLAVDLGEHWSVGGSFLGVLGGEARNRVACCGTDSGNRAFSATAATFLVRATTVSPLQLWLEGGIGIGHLISLQTDSAFEHPPYRGRAGVSTRLAAGAGWRAARQVRLGVELAWVLWTRVEHGPGGGYSVQTGPAEQGLTTSAVLLLVSTTFSLFDGDR